jgi:hypothetical protein
MAWETTPVRLSHETTCGFALSLLRPPFAVNLANLFADEPFEQLVFGAPRVVLQSCRRSQRLWGPSRSSLGSNGAAGLRAKSEASDAALALLEFLELCRRLGDGVDQAARNNARALVAQAVKTQQER